MNTFVNVYNSLGCLIDQVHVGENTTDTQIKAALKKMVDAGEWQIGDTIKIVEA